MRLREYVNFYILIPLFGSVVVDNGVVAVVFAVVVTIDVVVGVLVVIDVVVSVFVVINVTVVVVVGAENTIIYIDYIFSIETLRYPGYLFSITCININYLDHN